MFIAVFLFAVVVKSVPLTDKNQTWLIGNQDLSFESESTEELEDYESYRLPNNSLPIRYDLWLKTDIDKSRFEFTGQVKIHIRVVEPTRRITLHARNLAIDNIDLLNVDKTSSVTDLDYNYDKKVEFLKIIMPFKVESGDEIILDIKYHGTLREDNFGFYRASYENVATGRTVWYATTQFQTTDARHAMPCYDEPGIRAIYGVSIQHDQSLDAISNMPISTREPLPGTNYVTSKFEDTVVMQSYLLAFIISDYKYTSNNDLDVEQRVFAVPQRIDNGDGDFALGVVGPVLRQLEDHFQVKYPLPKMDHAAITDYIWGAMENFGLITYQDSGVLFVQGSDTESKKLSIIELIAHEYTHQYFGNTVSPKWWAYTWLNEGFATLFANFIPSLIYPENDHMGRFETNALSAAFRIDSDPNVAPLNFYVQTPIDIRNKFGTVSYQKGGAVLRMIQEVLSVPTFRKGLNYYLTEMYLQAVTPQDLHRNLQKAYDEDSPGNEVDLDSVMRTWEEQAGYPVITVRKIDETFFMTQNRFGGGNEIYNIPVSYTLKTEAQFDTSTPRLWFDTRSIALSSHEDWIILNIHNTAYFKISYDDNIFAAIAADLQANHEIISPYHRAQLFADMRTSLLVESFEAFYGLEHLKYLSSETVFSVWNQAFGVESIFADHLFGTDRTNHYYHEFLHDVYLPHINRLGFTGITGESSNDVSLRGLITTLSCKAYQPECLSYELQRLRNFIATGQGSYDVCSGLRRADENFHTSLIDDLLAGRLSNSATFRNNLGCPLDQELIRNYLRVVLDESNSLTSAERLTIIQQTATKSTAALNATLDLILQNYVAIQQIIPGDFITVVSPMINYINNIEHLAKYREILDLARSANYLTASEVDQLLASVNVNFEWLDRNWAGIEAWLNNEVPIDETTAPTAPTPTPTVPSTSTTSAPSTVTVSSTTPSSVEESSTLGSTSMVASFTIILICVFGKFFV